MKRKRVIVICIIFLLLALLGIVYLTKYQKKEENPDEVQIREQEKADLYFESLLEQNKENAANNTYIVVINPAHGGLDAGNTALGLSEKAITLAIAQKIKDQNTDESVGIFLTRETDTNPTKEQRETMIEQLAPDLYIELHLNADTNEETFGTAVFYNDTYYDEKLTNATFADMMEKSTVTAIEGKAIGVFPASVEQYIHLFNKKIPAVSIECGYITNQSEGTLLSQDNYQINFANGVLAGIDEALNELQ